MDLMGKSTEVLANLTLSPDPFLPAVWPWTSPSISNKPPQTRDYFFTRKVLPPDVIIYLSTCPSSSHNAIEVGDIFPPTFT